MRGFDETRDQYPAASLHKYGLARLMVRFILRGLISRFIFEHITQFIFLLIDYTTYLGR